MSIFRTAIERFSRGRILKRHLPDDLGRVPLLVSPDSSLGLWKPRLDSDLFDFAREFVAEGSVVWDVGANVGLFAMAAAQRAGAAGSVVAVEADLWLAGLLQRSAAMQPPASAPVQVIPAAVASSLAIASFHIARRGRSSNFLDSVEGLSQAGGIRGTVQVVTITLDWLLEQGSPPTALKIDVEGAELSVLRGGSRILGEIRPAILCEVSERTRAEVTKLFLSHGYALYDWNASPRTRIERAAFNTLALPAKA